MTPTPTSLSQGSGGHEGPAAERKPREKGNLGEQGVCPRPELSSQSLKRTINRLLVSVCVEG